MSMPTEQKMEFIVQAIKASGISMTDFSRLTGISRTSLYAWKQAGYGADKFRLNVAYNYAVRLDLAVKAGRLPLEGLWTAKERTAELRKIIAETNKEMKS